MIPSLQSVPPDEAAPITLKLFASGPKLSPHSTLRDCCDVYLWPALEREEVSEATLAEYAIFLNLWERYTGDISVGSIDYETAKEFRDALSSKPFHRGERKCKRSPATVNKIMRYFRSVMRKLWPADRTNPEGPGLVKLFHLPKTLQDNNELPFVFSRRDLSALYVAADAARPSVVRRGSMLHRAELWRLAIVLAFNIGLRAGDLRSLRWDDIRWDDFRAGAVLCRSRKVAKLQRLPLNRIARLHLDHVRALQLDSDRIFPTWTENSVFYDAWRRITASAGLSGTVFEDMRKTCSTHLNRVIPEVGAWVCGHGPKDVNGKHYTNPTNDVLKAIYTLKQPAAFRQGARELLQRLQASPAG